LTSGRAGLPIHLACRVFHHHANPIPWIGISAGIMLDGLLARSFKDPRNALKPAPLPAQQGDQQDGHRQAKSGDSQ
jgi:hypothetical protein